MSRLPKPVRVREAWNVVVAFVCVRIVLFTERCALSLSGENVVTATSIHNAPAHK